MLNSFIVRFCCFTIVAVIIIIIIIILWHAIKLRLSLYF